MIHQNRSLKLKIYQFTNKNFNNFDLISKIQLSNYQNISKLEMKNEFTSKISLDSNRNESNLQKFDEKFHLKLMGKIYSKKLNICLTSIESISIE